MPYLNLEPAELREEPRMDEGLGDIEFCTERVIRGLNALSSMTIDDPVARAHRGCGTLRVPIPHWSRCDDPSLRREY